MKIARIFCIMLACLVFGAMGAVRLAGSGILREVTPQAAGDYDNIEAVLDTSKGEIVIDFFPKDAPRHVENFVKNARDGVYDGTTFHRLVKYGLIQGGEGEVMVADDPYNWIGAILGSLLLLFLYGLFASKKTTV